MIMRGGRVRDSAYYSITVQEWPAVRAGLEARLARHAARAARRRAGSADRDDPIGPRPGRRGDRDDLAGPSAEQRRADRGAVAEPTLGEARLGRVHQGVGGGFGRVIGLVDDLHRRAHARQAVVRRGVGA